MAGLDPAIVTDGLNFGNPDKQLGFAEVEYSITVMSLKIETTNAPNWFGVSFRKGSRSFNSVNIFIHPNPAHAGMTDDTFLEFALLSEVRQIKLRQTMLTDAGLKAVVGLGKLEEFRCEGSVCAVPANALNVTAFK